MRTFYMRKYMNTTTLWFMSFELFVGEKQQFGLCFELFAGEKQQFGL